MILQLSAIAKSYRLGDRTIPVVQGVDFVLEAGEFVSIMGQSGSGKSTLLQMMGLLERPSSGKIFSDGQELSSLSDRQQAIFRGQKIGFVFQSFRLLPQYNALDNVLLPLVYAGQMQRKDDAKKLLDRLGLSARMHHRPSELSGGECQRVAICRALVNHPSILLADEPTGALDSRTGNEIMEILLDLHAEGLSLVLVTHEAQLGKMAQRLLHFRDGRLAN